MIEVYITTFNTKHIYYFDELENVDIYNTIFEITSEPFDINKVYYSAYNKLQKILTKEEIIKEILTHLVYKTQNTDLISTLLDFNYINKIKE